MRCAFMPYKPTNLHCFRQTRMASTLTDIRGYLECLESLQTIKGGLTVVDYEIDYGFEKTIERKASDLCLAIEASTGLSTALEMMEVLDRMLQCRTKVGGFGSFICNFHVVLE